MIKNTAWPLIILLGLALACQKEASEETRQVKTYTIEQFMDNTNVSGSSFSPDEAYLLITSNRSGIYNAYRQPVAGGDYSALTQSDSSSIYALSYFPKDERILFQMDDNGN